MEIAGTGFNLDITAVLTDGAADPTFTTAYAYLDWNHAGLGVCGNVDEDDIDVSREGYGSNVCIPGSDDNVTDYEILRFVFDTDVVIDRIWFNNTHDEDWDIIGPEDYILIDGSRELGPGNGYATGNDYNNTVTGADVGHYLGDYSSLAGHEFTIAFDNQQFYVSGIEVHAVPEPAAVTLFGLGLLGMGLARRRKKA